MATQPNTENETIKKSSTSGADFYNLVRKIYDENRKKAEESRDRVMPARLGPQYIQPLYNKPSETAVYQENMARNNTFKYKLRAHLTAKYMEAKINGSPRRPRLLEKHIKPKMPVKNEKQLQ